MVRGYRALIIALVGLILIGASALSKPLAEVKQAQEQREITDALKEISTSLKEAQKSDQTAKPCKPGETDRNSDLCAQWKAADAASEGAEAAKDAAKSSQDQVLVGWIGLLLGFVTMLAAIGAAYWAKNAAQHTESGAKEAQNANLLTRESDRPWVTVKINVRKMYRLGDAFRWDFDIISENVGKTVAVDYCRFFHVVIYKPHELSNIESWFNIDDPDKTIERDFILPGETVTRQSGYGVLDRDNIWSSFSTQIAKGLEIIVGIDVFYKSKESTEWCQTRRSFKISKTLSDGSASCFLPTDSLETNFTVTDWGVGLAK
jgi:hypothetical protein